MVNVVRMWHGDVELFLDVYLTSRFKIEDWVVDGGMRFLDRESGKWIVSLLCVNTVRTNVKGRQLRSCGKKRC